MHIEIDSWNPYSNKLVCKMQGRELLSTMREGELVDLKKREGPEIVSAALRLEKDFMTLGRLAQGDHPIKKIIRVHNRIA